MAFNAVVDKAKLEGAITATANAIRAKTGNTEKITWNADSGFSDAVDALSAEEIIQHAAIPDYIKAEALRVAIEVEKVRKEGSIVFLAMSDSHHCGEQSNTSWQANTNIGNLHAAMAAKILSYALNMDFVCQLGDLTFGNGSTTSAQLHQQLAEMGGWLDEAQKNIPAFWTVGNHDTGLYAVSNGTESNPESAEYLFSVFGRRCEGATYGSTTHGYCYRDFSDKKLRVICLNSSEQDGYSYSAGASMSQAQLLWFAQTLQGVGANAGWSVMVLSHYPLDFYNAFSASDVVRAYVEGKSITLNGTAVNFSGKNLAKFVANFHGHTHCFKYAKLHQVNHAASSAEEYDAWRVAIPNTGFYRNNHQADVDAHGISFKDDQTWDKTIGGAKDTAFVVNVIDPDNEVIRSFTYGAGPEERSIGYGASVYYRITSSVSNAVLSNTAGSIEENESYTTTVTPNEHCSVTSVMVKMGGVDITSTVYADGVISIPKVTGNVVIDVKAAIALACTNQIPISTDASGAIYNGKGYKANTYVHNGVDTSMTGIYSTGFIPVKEGDIVRLKNMPFSKGDAYHRIVFYDANKTYTKQAGANSSWYVDSCFNGVLDGNNYVQFTLQGASDITPNAKFIRICCANISDASILTVNEEIKYADEVEEITEYSITNMLTDAVNSNSASSVAAGGSYSATITANDGYELKNVSILMGGIDVTSSVYTNGVISVSSVTGNIVITVVATAIATANYTNQLPISTDASGAVYNGKGWKENTYLSGGNEGSRDGIYTSGFIPTVLNEYGSAYFYLKNVGIKTGQESHRICTYKSDKTVIGTFKATTTGAPFTEYGDDGNLSLITFGATAAANIAFIRICCGYLGEDSIITSNEEIV